MFRSLSLAALIAATFASPSLRAQPRPHDSVRGAVRLVDVRARTLDVVTGVGYALRVVRLEVPQNVSITASGMATLTLSDLQPGDIVAASFGGTVNFVAYSIRRVGRMETGPGETP